MFMWVISAICLFWMHNVIRIKERKQNPDAQKNF